MAYLDLSFFNSFDAFVQGKRVTTLRSTKVRGLLVYMLLEAEKSHEREWLATLFWPDKPQVQARHNLRQSLYQLRRVLGETDSDGVPLLTTTRHSVQFNCGCDYALDVELFDDTLAKGDLEGAIHLYIGELLPAFTCDSLTFEEWLHHKREMYHRLMLSALYQVAEQQLAQGGAALGKAQAMALRQLELEPWREEAHRQLMHALVLAGNRSAAIAQFDRCAEILADELGVSPSPETFALFEAIRDGTFSPTVIVEKGEKVPNNIPHQTMPFVGRSTEIRQLLHLLADPNTRLITIVAPGGMGKTRLALETARYFPDSAENPPFPNGIFFIDLTPVASKEAMMTAIASAFGFAIERELEPLQQILNFLANKELLLLLDNFEQLIAAPVSGAEVIVAILQAAPNIKIIVTSRQKCNLSSELVFALEGLAVPNRQSLVDAQAFGSVQLFVQSARRVQPTFQLTDQNWPHVTHICNLVAGMPLGILLTAAWIDLLSPAEIAYEMQADIDFLASEMADLPPRQRSMRAVFDHSWALLSGPEKQMFAKLSVFRDGFTREAAQAVADAPLRLLSALANKSLIQRDVSSGRFIFHELLRQLAAEKLSAQSSEIFVRTAHSRYYLTWLASHEEGLEKYKVLETVQILRRDEQNIRAAWLWAAKKGEAGLLLSVMRALSYYYVVTERQVDAIRLYKQTLQQLPSGDSTYTNIADNVTFARASLLNHLQDSGLEQDDQGQPIDIDQLYAFFKARGAKLDEALVCQHLAERALREQNFSQAMTFFQTQMEIYEQENEVLRLSFILARMAFLEFYAGRIEVGLKLSQRITTLAEQYNNPRYKAVGLYFLALYTLHEKIDYATTQAQLTELTAMTREIWLDGLGAIQVLAALNWQGFVALLQGQLAQAQQFSQKMTEIADVTNNPRDKRRAETMASFIRTITGQYQAVNWQVFESLVGGVLNVGPIGITLTAYGQGNIPLAVTTIVNVWSVPITMRWPSILLRYIPIVASLLADQGEFSRAVALLAAGRAHPACPHGLWDIMALLPELEGRLQATLSREDYAAAQVQGQQTDLQEMAHTLLTELKSLVTTAE